MCVKKHIIILSYNTILKWQAMVLQHVVIRALYTPLVKHHLVTNDEEPRLKLIPHIWFIFIHSYSNN